MWERPCAKVREQIALSLYGELNHAETREVEAHLAACPRCRAEFAEWERTRGELDLWMTPTVSAERWQEFSFALQERITASPRRVTSPARALTFAAALCVLAALTFIHRAPRYQTMKEPRIADSVQKPPAPPPRSTATRTQLSSPTAARHPERGVRLRRAPRRPHREPVKAATTLVAQKPPLNEEPFIEELPQTHALVAVRQTMTPDVYPPSFAYQTTIVDASGQTILSSAVPPGQVSVGTVLAWMPMDVVFGQDD